MSLIERIIIPLAIIAGALLLGVFLRNVVFSYLQKLAKRTKWRFDDVVIDAARSGVILWSLAVGLYVLIQTQGLSRNAAEILSKALGVLVIFSVTVVASNIGTGIIEYYRSVIVGLASATSLLKNIIRVTVYSIGVLIILDDLHISIAPLLTALGVGGLAIGLGLQETLSNFFSGLQILAARQIQVGNYVRLSTGDEGYVEDLNWRATVIRTLSGNHVIVPNKNIASLIVTNYERPMPEVSVSMNVGVDYSSDLDKVEAVTIEVARDVQKTVAGAKRDFEPFIRYNQFGDSSIDFSVIMRGNSYVDQYLMKHEFIKRLKARYDKEGISIPFPARTVYMSKGDA
ncbi:MAG: mechanosensitive ion channel family protein [Bacteroidetes bacterium]|nr:mechanosensitive ion channel family protein [Bacteroidota bacterium]MCL5034331.1 mechanosensitive ion channel family protein [Bacteroidota bacterium]